MRNRQFQQCKNGEAGFSLLEILVALMILAIGLVAVFLLFGQGVSMQGTSVNQVEASRLAETVFSEIQYLALETGNLPKEVKRKKHAGFSDRYRFSLSYPGGDNGAGGFGTPLVITIHWQRQGQEQKLDFFTILQVSGC